MLYTAQQVAEVIDKPPSTCRFWANKYREFIPKKKRGRFFVYTEQSLDVFRKIATLQDNGLFKEQVIDELEKTFGSVADAVETVEKAKDKKEPLEELTLVLVDFMTEFRKANEAVEKKFNLIVKGTQLVLAEPDNKELSGRRTGKGKDSSPGELSHKKKNGVEKVLGKIFRTSFK